MADNDDNYPLAEKQNTWANDLYAVRRWLQKVLEN
jgi:hypothetical protein